MRKALVTFGVGTHVELLRLSSPLFAAYAQRHGYDYLVADAVEPHRPPSWYKVPTMASLLDDYDAVLWLGCDVVIADGTVDIADQIAPDAWQALVKHHTSEGEIPNCDVWWATKPMQPWLGRAWAMSQYTNHCWWEQAAILELLGYTPWARPVQRVTDTELYDHTAWLPLEWNSHEQDDRAENPRFAHATPNGIAWRVGVMQKYIKAAQPHLLEIA